MGGSAMHLVETKGDKGHGFQLGRQKRRYPRAMIEGFVGNLADGMRVVEGRVGNISTGGFEFINIPESFTAEKHSYTVKLASDGKYYKLLVKPCWRKAKSENVVDIGFKILDAPLEWLAYTINNIPVKQNN